MRPGALRVPAAASVILLLALLVVAGPAQAAEPDMEAPGEFRNGQDNDFGSIAMAPYLAADEGSMPIQATIVLRDLEAVEAATDLLFAFNVKGDAVRATIDSLQTLDGKTLTPVRTDVVEDGRQPQAHFVPADVLGAAREGRIDLVLKGRVEAKADGQTHVGAMVIAFDEGWRTLPSGTGSAQLYGFTMVSTDGTGGGIMPFQGQGNTWALVPLALLAVIVAVAGAMAVSTLLNTPAPLTPAVAVGGTVASPAVQPAAPIPTFGQPQRPATFGGAPVAPAAVPVFGGPAPPAPAAAARRPPAAVAGQVPVASSPERPASSVAVRVPATPVPPIAPPGPVQGPLLPAHPLDRTPMAALLRPRAATSSAGRPASAPGQARTAPAAGAVLTATKRPKAGTAGAAKSSGKAGDAARRSSRSQVPAQLSR